MTPQPQRSPYFGFLPEIIAAPDNDELRLQCATALETEFPQRANLIRLQITLANLTSGVDHPEWFRLASEADDLLLKQAPAWTPDWYQTKHITQAEFHRGFIEAVTVPFLDLYTWQNLFASNPIRQLRIINLTGDSDLLRLLPILARQNLTALHLDAQYLTDEAVLSFLNYSFPNLQTLSLAHNDLHHRSVAALAEASQPNGTLPLLRTVNLQGNPYDPTEQLHEDQGVLVSRHIPPDAVDLPPTPWLYSRS